MIRAILMLAFWGVCILLLGPALLLLAFLTGDIDSLYHRATRLGNLGVRLGGVTIEIVGMEHLRAGQNYIFMSNHVSNLDPPVLIPMIPGRCSVLVKKQLFHIPVLGTGMKMADLVPVDRDDREAAIESVNAAQQVLRKGLHMVTYPEGTRSADGRLRPFKKGPFHLAINSGVPIIPVTMLGTYEAWPKGRFALKPGTATVVFHPAIDPGKYSDYESLRAAVSESVASALPPERQTLVVSTG